METTSFFKSSAGVFQGGGCRAAAFVGGYSEAIRRGVSFAEVAGTSAGSIVRRWSAVAPTLTIFGRRLRNWISTHFCEQPCKAKKEPFQGAGTGASTICKPSIRSGLLFVIAIR